MKNVTENPFSRVEKTTQTAEHTTYDRSLKADLKRSLKANPASYFCIGFLIFIILCSVFAFLSPYDPEQMDMLNKMKGISAEHWMGTDKHGRDYLTRALYGGRVSLLVGFCSMLCSTVFGTVLGTVSGYMGGKVDSLLMRFTDVFVSMPSFLFMSVINIILSPTIATVVIVISAFGWTNIARITRAETMSLKQRDFVLAAQTMGASHFRIIFKHLIPNMSSSITVAASLSVARAILVESSLSYLGLGVKLPIATWGNMLQDAQTFILSNPVLAVVPGLLILLTVLSFNVLGEVLRTALEPRMIK